MQFRGKALYNLLRSNWLKDPKLAVKPWQVEDYRVLPTDELFSRLKKFNISLNEHSFVLYSENCESPEELLEHLYLEDGPEEQDQVYLLVFELWRRFVPEKRSLSIFCDDLDYYIVKNNDEDFQKILIEFEDILDENVDMGGDPKEIFSLIEESCAHDIESFLYDYIVQKIDEKDETYASELIEGFYDYVSDPRWFDFLRARIFALTAPEEANLVLGGLLEELEEYADFDLLYEMASFLAKAGDPELFVKAIKLGAELMQTPEDLDDLLELLGEYFRLMDKEEKYQEIQKYLKTTPKNKEGLLSFLEDAERREV